MTKLRAAAVAALVAIALAVSGGGPAGAQQTSVEAAVEVTDASKGACTNGTAAWSVDADITITNSSEGEGRVTRVDYEARWHASGGEGGTAPAEASDPGGLVPGATIPPGETRTFSVTVETVLPCDATSAALAVLLEFENGHKVFEASDDFMSDGTPVPLGSIGLLGAAGLGVLLFGGRRLGSRRSH